MNDSDKKEYYDDINKVREQIYLNFILFKFFRI